MGMGLLAWSFRSSVFNKNFQHFCCKKSVDRPQSPCEFNIFLTTDSELGQAYLLSEILTEILRRKYYTYTNTNWLNNFR